MGAMAPNPTVTVAPVARTWSQNRVREKVGKMATAPPATREDRTM